MSKVDLYIQGTDRATGDHHAEHLDAGIGQRRTSRHGTGRNTTFETIVLYHGDENIYGGFGKEVELNGR